MTKVGFIGVGIMGRPMAARLMEGRHELFLVRHRSPLPEELIKKGAHVCRSGREVAENAEVVFAIVPHTPDVEEVLFARDGVAEGLKPGKVFVDMSSTAPGATRVFARRVGTLGADYLDAPVSGGEVGARQGTLTIMVGGPEPAFERVKPLFALMGQNITRVGDNGHGQIAKVANQIVVALTIEAVAEALLFAARAGADVRKVRAALMGGFASSRILEVHGARMIERDFEPGGRLNLHRKDLDHALAAAREL
ncbi:MAG: NAD(P)-dependent oxidoreductase, partial [Alphaproteobacteria bacterium]